MSLWMAVPFTDVADDASGATGGLCDRLRQASNAALEGAGAGLAVGGRRQACDHDDGADVEVVVSEQHTAGLVRKALRAHVPKLLFHTHVNEQGELTKLHAALGGHGHIVDLHRTANRITLPYADHRAVLSNGRWDLLGQSAGLPHDPRVGQNHRNVPATCAAPERTNIACEVIASPILLD